MSNSVDRAFLQIARQRGLLPVERLEAALEEASARGTSLEIFLVESGELDPLVLGEVSRARSRHARSCKACGKTTFLLPDQTEADTPCEHCQGTLRRPARPTSDRLQVRSKPPNGPRRGRPPSGASPRPPSGPQRSPSERRPSERLARRRPPSSGAHTAPAADAPVTAEEAADPAATEETAAEEHAPPKETSGPRRRRPPSGSNPRPPSGRRPPSKRLARRRRPSSGTLHVPPADAPVTAEEAAADPAAQEATAAEQNAPPAEPTGESPAGEETAADHEEETAAEPERETAADHEEETAAEPEEETAAEPERETAADSDGETTESDAAKNARLRRLRLGAGGFGYEPPEGAEVAGFGAGVGLDVAEESDEEKSARLKRLRIGGGGLGYDPQSASEKSASAHGDDEPGGEAKTSKPSDSGVHFAPSEAASSRRDHRRRAPLGATRGSGPDPLATRREPGGGGARLWLALALLLGLVAAFFYLEPMKWFNSPYDWQPQRSEAMTASRAQNKPMIVYITDPAFPPCERFAAQVIADPRVEAIAGDFVWHLKEVKLERDEGEGWESARLPVGLPFKPPIIQFFAPDGTEIPGEFETSELTVEQFLDLLRKVKQGEPLEEE